MTELLPNLYIAGVEKAGTSFLYDLLAQHPEIYAPSVKEPRMFLEGLWNDKAALSWNEYHGLFKGAGDELYRMDGSPQYFYFEEAMRRIAEKTQDKAKIIIVLRDPVGRAYSHYQMMLALGSVPRFSFSEIFSRSTDRNHPMFESSAPYRHLFARSFYHDRLRSIYATFPREQVLCFVFEELKNDWGRGGARALEFLGLESVDLDLKHSRRNAGYRVDGRVGRSLVSLALKCGRPLKEMMPVSVYDWMKTHVMRSGEMLSQLEPSPERDDWARLNDIKRYYAEDVEKFSDLQGSRPPWLLQ